jgi:hypothetical protein
MRRGRDTRADRKAGRVSGGVRDPRFAKGAHLRAIDGPGAVTGATRPRFAAITGATDVLAGSRIRGDLRARLAVARVAEQPPASTPRSLMLGTIWSSAWAVSDEMTASPAKRKPGDRARSDPRHGPCVRRM